MSKEVSTATLTSKGQITLPKRIRALLGVSAGDRLTFVVDPDGRVVVEAATLDVRALRARFRADRPISIEEMTEAIRRRGSRR